MECSNENGEFQPENAFSKGLRVVRVFQISSVLLIIVGIGH
jgi:hypothetical protein